MVPKTTLETLKHKINPSLDLPAPQTVHVLLYTPGEGKQTADFLLLYTPGEGKQTADFLS